MCIVEHVVHHASQLYDGLSSSGLVLCDDVAAYGKPVLFDHVAATTPVPMRQLYYVAPLERDGLALFVDELVRLGFECQSLAPHSFRCTPPSRTHTLPTPPTPHTPQPIAQIQDREFQTTSSTPNSQPPNPKCRPITQRLN
jgi:hypothetical protein